jgi:hypothetical protein
VPLGPHVPAPVDERRRGQRPLAHPVDVQQLERRAGPQHERLAVVVGEEDLAVDGTGDAENPSRCATPSRP